MAGVSQDTINRLSWKTVRKAFQKTLPIPDKQLQILASAVEIRSVQGVAYRTSSTPATTGPPTSIEDVIDQAFYQLVL